MKEAKRPIQFSSFSPMRPRLMSLVAVCAGCLSFSLQAAILSWSGGGGANAYWNDSANWGFAGTPGNGDTLIFSAGQPDLLNTNNLVGLTLNRVVFVGAGGGYDIRGNAFTLTNNIEATNSAGANTIENDITLAGADQSADVTVSLTLSGVLSGSVGLIKNGAGTLLINGPFSNTYGGTTTVNSGLVQLAKNGSEAAGIPGDLVIGNGSASATVQNTYPYEIVDSANLTINNNGLWDLNNNFETIGTNLILNGTITTGTGTCTLSPNNTITVPPGGSGSISGNFNVNSGTCTIQNDGNLDIAAVISGSANITKNGAGSTHFYGANVFTGSFTANGSSYVWISNPLGLGTTNGGTTLNDNTWLALSGNMTITNEALTVNSAWPSGTLYLFSNDTNTWTGPLILNANITILTFTNCGLVLTGSISGPGGFTKIQPGVLTLAGPANSSSYTGDTIVNEGILFLKSGNVIRYGTLTIGDGLGGPNADIVRYLTGSCIYGGPGGSTVVINNTGLLDLNGFTDDVGPIYMDGGTINTGGGTLQLFPPLATVQSNDATNGNSTLNGNLELVEPSTIAVSNNLVVNAVISDASGNTLTKTGPGNLYVTGANTYTGPTLIQQGYVWAENNLALGAANDGTVVSSGATLVLNGTCNVTNEALTINGPGEPEYGALDVESGIHTWAGPITNNATSTLDSWGPGSELHINGSISGAGGLELFNQGVGGGTEFFEGSTANTYGGLTTVDTDGTLTLKKSAAIKSVPGNLVVNNGATVNLGNNEQLGTSVASLTDVQVDSGGLFYFANYFDYINTLHGGGTVNFGVNGYLIIGGNNGTSEFDGVMTGTGYTLGGYTVGKFGSGTFTLGGNNTFTAGATHVYFGKLVVNGSQPQVPAIVDSGATFGGSGSVSTILANGTVSPGNSPGILTSSNVTFNSSGNFTVELSGPNPGVSGYDQLNVSGTVSLANAALAVFPLFTTPVAIGQQFTIINNDLADAVSGTFNSLPEGSTISISGYQFTISYVGGTGNDVVLTLTSIPGAVTGSGVASGNGSHGIDPNDCNNLSLVITNTTGTPMNGANATLSTTTEGVLITQPYSPYPNIAANGEGTNIVPFQISTLPSFVCGTPINLQLSVDSSLGSFTMNFVQPTGEAAAPVRFDNNNVTNCPDVGTIESTNNVASWSGGPITKVVVSLWLGAPYDSDMSLSLIAPDGTTVPLAAGVGGSNPNFGTGSADASRTTFDDAGGISIAAGTAPFVGTFQPQGSLASLVGTAPVGAWRLHIQDSGFYGAPDTLRAWSLSLHGTSCSSGSGACDVCMSAITNAITLSDPVQNGRWIGNVVVASCGTPKTWAGTFAGSFHYNAYLFTNTSPADACVTVELQSPSNILTTAYLNGFNPTNITLNYLGDAGNSTHGGQTTFSCSVPAGASFVVVVTEVNASAGTQPYTLQLSGLPCPPPTLNIAPVTPNQARLYWSTAAGGYLLEGQSNIVSSAWATVTNEPIVNGGNYNVTNSAMNPTNRFYRLHKP